MCKCESSCNIPRGVKLYFSTNDYKEWSPTTTNSWTEAQIWARDWDEIFSGSHWNILSSSSEIPDYPVKSLTSVLRKTTPDDLKVRTDEEKSCSVGSLGYGQRTKWPKPWWLAHARVFHALFSLPSGNNWILTSVDRPRVPKIGFVEGGRLRRTSISSPISTAAATTTFEWLWATSRGLLSL